MSYKAIIVAVVVILLVGVTAIYLAQPQDGSEGYPGSQNPLTGEWCDFGYNIKNQQCCQDDDYSCEICTWKNYDCADFKTQPEAQMYYNECKECFINIDDVHNLDGDEDGIACEALPRK